VTAKEVQDDLPEGSVAMRVIVLLPTASGMDALQEDVPLAIPLAPVVEFDHVTTPTPPGSDAVPETARGDDVDVEENGLTIRAGEAGPPGV
jgi:hypothetical protein